MAKPLWICVGKRDGLQHWRLRAWDGTRQVSQTFKVAGKERGVRAAQIAQDEFERKLRRNPDNDPNRTLGDLWDASHELMRDTGQLSPTTLYDYWKVMTYRIVPDLGKERLGDITSYKLDAYYAKQLKRGLSARSVVKYHRILSSVFRQAEKWGWIEQSPTRNATPPRAPKAQTITPGINVVRELIQACDDPRMQLLILLAASLGPRRGELVALRWSDLQADRATIESSAYELRGGGVGIKATKTEKARVLAIDPRSSKALEAIRGDGFVFSDDGITPWRPDRVSKLFAKVRAKVPSAAGVRLHDLRHFQGSGLADAGLPIAEVSNRLGHTRQSTTQDIYIHALGGLDGRAAKIVDTWALDGKGRLVDP